MANNDSFMPDFPVDTDALLSRGRLGATTEQTDAIIDKLQQQSYINDARYCQAFVHDKVAFQAWGRMKIIMGLRTKHLPDELIDNAIAAIDEQAYNANIRKLLLSKRNQDRQKQLRFMLQRGYTFDDLSSLNTQH